MAGPETAPSSALLPTADVVVPDLRGFGASDKHPADPTRQYSPDAQARSIVALIEELRLDRPVLAGHDIGSRVARTLARQRPDLVRALVLAPPRDDRILTAEPAHLVPERVYLSAGWRPWLRMVIAEVA